MLDGLDTEPLTRSDAKTVRRSGIARALTVVQHPDRRLLGTRRVIDADDRELTLGRDHGALTALISDPKASRGHARITVDGSTLTLEDLGSRNGTFVDGRRITGPTVLTPRSIIQIGNTMLAVASGSLEHGDAALPELIGKSLALAEVVAHVQQVAESKASVLILGETGVGKELVAGAIHRLSGRKGELVSLNGATVTESLVESELFGHRRGAFSGALGRGGLLFRAHNGTFLLDEGQDTSNHLQAAMLRVVESGEIRAVGDDTVRRVDVRYIAAVQPDPGTYTCAAMRRDLWNRLAEVLIFVPPLRQRLADIIPLAIHFARHRVGTVNRVDGDLALRMLMHDWPGNVRELRRVVLAAEAGGRDGEVLRASPAALRVFETADTAVSAPRTPERRPRPRRRRPRHPRPERAELLAALCRANGRVADAAGQLDVRRSTLYRWLAHYEIDLSAREWESGSGEE